MTASIDVYDFILPVFVQFSSTGSLIIHSARGSLRGLVVFSLPMFCLGEYRSPII